MFPGTFMKKKVFKLFLKKCLFFPYFPNTVKKFSTVLINYCFIVTQGSIEGGLKSVLLDGFLGTSERQMFQDLENLKQQRHKITVI